ncbi:hypothetical protein Bca101_095966 [Brassica carinata]
MKHHHLRRRTLTSSHGDSDFFPSSPAKNIVIIFDEAHRFSNDAISNTYKSYSFFLFSLFATDINTMGDSVPEILAFPELKYPIRSEPKPRVSINQYSSAAYIKTVSGISSHKS